MVTSGFKRSALFILVSSLAFAADGLVSNFTFAVLPAQAPGELWTLSRGDAGNGASRVQLQVGGDGVQVAKITQVLFNKDYVGVNDQVFAALTGEHRRTLALSVGQAIVFQGFVVDSTNAFVVPRALLRIKDDNSDSIVLNGAGLADAVHTWPGPLAVAANAGAVERGNGLWLARGPWGITHVATSPDSWDAGSALTAPVVTVLSLNAAAARLDTIKKLADLDTAHTLAVWGLALDSATGTLWLGSEHGLWQASTSSPALQPIHQGGLDSLRITGVWKEPNGPSLFVESSKRVGSKTVSSLWRSLDNGQSFTALTLPYDSLDVSVSAVAFVGNTAWLAVQGIENSQAGLLRVGPAGAEQWPDSLRMPKRESSSQWIWGLEAKILDRDVTITGVSAFPLGNGLGLAVSTYGAGISVSADSGHTWKPILNQKSVKGNLTEVRMVPSVMRGFDAVSVVAYRLDKPARVSIDVFSYDMKKVHSIVSHAQRSSSPIRSSDATADVWNGRDDAGNPVALGVYFVRVQDDSGHEAWGKVMWLGGQK